jgi:hypothetical protein
MFIILFLAYAHYWVCVYNLLHLLRSLQLQNPYVHYYIIIFSYALKKEVRRANSFKTNSDHVTERTTWWSGFVTGRSRDISLSHSIEIGSGSLTAPCVMGTRALSPGRKRPGSDSNLRLLSSSEVENSFSYTSTQLLALMVQCLLKYRHLCL